MPIRRPSIADLQKSSDDRHLQLSEAELKDFHELVCENMDLYDELEQYPDKQRPVIAATRIPLGRPDPKDDPLNAIVQYCSVTTGKKGPLSKRAIRDVLAIRAFGPKG